MFFTHSIQYIMYNNNHSKHWPNYGSYDMDSIQNRQWSHAWSEGLRPCFHLAERQCGLTEQHHEFQWRNYKRCAFFSSASFYPDGYADSCASGMDDGNCSSILSTPDQWPCMSSQSISNWTHAITTIIWPMLWTVILVYAFGTEHCLLRIAIYTIAINHYHF